LNSKQERYSAEVGLQRTAIGYGKIDYIRNQAAKDENYIKDGNTNSEYRPWHWTSLIKLNNS
jgi:hypothetical protein